MEPKTLIDPFIKAPIQTLSHPLNPLPGVEATVKRKHINVLTYNLFLRPPLVKNNESDHKDDRLKEFIKLLPEYDIICCQEMFGFLNFRKKNLKSCAVKAGFHYYAECPGPKLFSTFIVDGGLLILSRFPIVATEFVTFPPGILADAISQKGVLYAKIHVKDDYVHVFTTHTQANYPGNDEKGRCIRGDQFMVMRNFIQSCFEKHHYKKDEVCLLMGDFNLDARNCIVKTEKMKKYPGLKLYPHLAEKETFNEYEAVMCILSDNKNDEVKDLLYQKYGEHPVTFGDTYIDENGKVQPLEKVLTVKHSQGSMQSIDYMLYFIPKKMLKKIEENEEKKGRIVVNEDSARVEKFFIKNRAFTQLSDHYGIVVSLEYKEKSEEPEKKVSQNDSKE